MVMKGVTDLEFFEVDEKVCLSLVPVTQVPLLPRVGERVLLPSGAYDVTEVHHAYVAIDPGTSTAFPASVDPLKIIVCVRKCQSDAISMLRAHGT
jgi:hypothetical protein